MALTSGDYLPFDNVGSGENGTVEGLIDMEGPASAFRYRKELQILVRGAADSDFTTVTGNWKVRIREDASRSVDGSYTGRILFEQEVKFRALITAIDVGGFFLVTWQPLTTKAYTTICNGEECAVIDADESDESKAAYGTDGAWRFLDTARLPTTLQSKIDLEYAVVGATDFESEGAATSGGYSFFAAWQSENYLCEFPEGAIFETVFDHWQVGTIDDEATFQVSYKPGGSVGGALYDMRVGTTWYFYVESRQVRCGSTRRLEGFVRRDEDAVVYDGPSDYLQAGRFGATLHVLIQDRGDLVMMTSYDEGVSWMATFSLGDNLKVLASQLSPDGGAYFVYAKATATIISNDPDNPARDISQNDIVRLILRLTSDGWKVAELGLVEGAILPTANLVGLACAGNTLHLMSNADEKLRLFLSVNQLKSLEALPVGA